MTTPAQTSNQATFDAYVIARSEEEAERLHEQAKLLEGPTSQVLDAVGLTAGMNCLDLGCGPGHVMQMIGERVGTTGHVTGFDVDGELGHRAANLLNSTGTSTYEFVEGDILQTDAIQDNTYSLVTARLLLLHLHDPVAALRRMWAWTRPGGYLAVIDYDLRTTSAFPPAKSVTECLRISDGVFTKACLDGGIGSKLPHYFESAGIDVPDGTRAEALIKPLGEVKGYVKSTYSGFLPAALQFGVTTPEQSAEFYADLEVDIARGTSYACSPLIVGVWKQKLAA